MRIQVNIGDDMVKKVDSIASLMGVSRSAFCSMVISKEIMNYDSVNLKDADSIENDTKGEKN